MQAAIKVDVDPKRSASEKHPLHRRVVDQTTGVKGQVDSRGFVVSVASVVWGVS